MAEDCPRMAALATRMSRCRSSRWPPPWPCQWRDATPDRRNARACAGGRPRAVGAFEMRV